MKVFTLALALILTMPLAAQEKMVSVPESQLTEQQKQSLKLSQVDSTLEKAHGWVGIGKELGQAFDSALGSLTARSNEFASTKVGKFTLFIVAWKVMGEQALQVLNAVVHLFAGGIELLIFMPLFVLSYRRSCMTRRVVKSISGPFWNRKKEWEIIEYDPDGEFTPRHGHALTLAIFTLIWLITVFSY